LWFEDVRKSDPQLADSVHVMNPFFYQLLKQQNGGYRNVQRWTAKVDIFSKKYIVVPINEDYHWYLAIIYEPEHVLRNSNLQKKTGLQNPPKCTHILTFDSLGYNRTETIISLGEYLRKEAMDKKGCLAYHKAVGRQVNVPLQDNYTDCGLYVIQFTHVFVGATEDFIRGITSIQKNKKLSKSELRERWKVHEVAERRDRLSDRITELSAAWQATEKATEKSNHLCE
ncbi:hypothetical protein HYDPIDRAFT_120561, partial [Hydnomerulius pinastri MD-312]